MKRESKVQKLGPAYFACSFAVALFGVCLAGCGLGSKTVEMTVSKDVSEKLNQLKPPAKVVDPASLPQYADRMLTKRTLQDSVADALARIGSDAVPALVDALSSPDSQRRENAARALARMGSKGSEAVPALIAALHDPDEEVRQNVVRALGQIGTGAKDAIPELISMLGSESSVPAIGQTPGSRPSAAPLTMPRYSEPNTTSPRYPESNAQPRFPESPTTMPRLPGPASTEFDDLTKPRNAPKPDTLPSSIPQTLPADQPGSTPRMPPTIPPP